MSLSERQTHNVEVLVGIKRPRIRQTPQRCVVVDLRLEGRVVVVAEDVHEIQVSGFFGKVSQRSMLPVLLAVSRVTCLKIGYRSRFRWYRNLQARPWSAAAWACCRSIPC